jgi:RNA polymerase sigma factor (sigma-70 family)
MATNPMNKVLHPLRRAALLKDGAGLTDGQLLEEYINRREEAALTALVRRHGPMVWGVCRRILRHYHDAEDAFQATFLVFVRKAASIAFPELLANWLYGVAHQTALKARATTAKRNARERQVAEMSEPATPEKELWSDLSPLLDQALSTLPDKYRVAIVLCDLEGKTRREAARQLGVPDGTVAARLARGRKMLAVRLARHGLAFSAGSLAAVLTQHAASASVPASVVSSTIRGVDLYAAGQAAAAGISVKAIALTEGVLKTMFSTKVKIATIVLLGVGLLGISWGLYPTFAAMPMDGQQETASPPPSECDALGMAGENPVKANQDGKTLSLPKGPSPVQVLVSLTKDGKLLAKMANLIGFGPADRQPMGQPRETIESIYDLDEVQVFDSKRRIIGKEEVAKILKEERVAVASFDGQPIDPLHFRILKEGTLVVILPVGGLPFPGGNHVFPPGLNHPIPPGLLPVVPPEPEQAESPDSGSRK